MVTNSTYSDIGVFTNGLFNETSILGEPILLQIIVLLIIAVLITRKMTRWGEVLFPTAIGLGISGMHISIILYVIFAIVFVVSILGVETVGATLSSGGENLRNVVTYGGKIGEVKHAKYLARREEKKSRAVEEQRYNDPQNIIHERTKNLYNTLMEDRKKGDVSSYKRKQLSSTMKGIRPIDNIASIGQTPKYPKGIYPKVEWTREDTAKSKERSIKALINSRKKKDYTLTRNK